MRPETRIRFLRELLAGRPITDRELARRLGIVQVELVTKGLESFVAQGYLTRQRPGPTYQLIRSPSVFEKIYRHTHYRQLRLDLRRQPWVIEATMVPYASLPAGLAPIVVEMLQCSHSFFEILRRYRSIAELEEFYAPYLTTLRLFAGEDEALCRYHLVHQLYAESIIRDIGSGGLPEGFLEPLDRIRDLIQSRFGDVHAHRREREAVKLVRALAPRLKKTEAASLLELCRAVEVAIADRGDGRADYTALLDQLRIR